MSARRRHLRPEPAAPASGLRLYGQRVMLRPLMATDFAQWSEVRRRNGEWLTRWEPTRPAFLTDPAVDEAAYVSRCAARDRERSLGTAFGFGLFVGGMVAGEVNLNNVLRGALQSATIGYWIDEAHAGNRYVAEAVVVLLRYAFVDLHLHRVEIDIVPRNRNSRRVMEVLGIREEGVAQRFLEINSVWEDHMRFGITVEEWHDREASLRATWL